MMERPPANSRSVLNGYDLNFSKRFVWDGWDSVAWAILCWVWGGVRACVCLCVPYNSSLSVVELRSICITSSVGRSTWGWLA